VWASRVGVDYLVVVCVGACVCVFVCVCVCVAFAYCCCVHLQRLWVRAPVLAYARQCLADISSLRAPLSCVRVVM